MDQRATMPADEDAAPRPKPLWANLYVQVIVAIVIGILVGHFYPDFGAGLKPLGDGYIKLIKMLIAPIIFCTVVHGIASMRDLNKVGRVGAKALIYFEVVTTLALVIGMVIANTVRPGEGMNIDPTTIDAKSVEGYIGKAKEQSTTQFLLDIIPNTVVGAFADGAILQVLLFALLFSFGLQSLGDRGKPLLSFIEQVSEVMFRIVGIIMKLAPIGAFGAMAFTIGKYGVESLASLAKLMLCFYATCVVFIFVVLGTIARLAGVSIFRFLYYIREELLIVLGTSSSESVLPRMIEKLKRLGCEESVVGLVVPTGYSFNLDGTCIYLTLAALFLAQATNVDLTLAQELGILGVLLLTSKGAAGVTGSGFIVLAATLSSIGTIPVASIALLLGIDRFMSEARALTNLIGNGIATLVVARWENALDREKLKSELEKA